jgi:gliding motility-associated-like protein
VDTFLCAADGLTLNATQGQTAVGTWSQMGQIGVVIADPASPNTSIQNLNPGNRYFFIWTLGDIGCGTSADTVTVYNYSVKPQISAPLFVCSDEDCAPLQAQALQPFEFGQWTSNDPRLTFTPPNTHNALVCNLQRGPNTIFWTTNGGACGSSSRDTIVINYELFPTAVADAVAVEFGNTAEVSVLPNDILPDEFTITIVVQPIGGSIVDTLSEGIFVYRPNSGFSGTDMMEYRICNTRCPDACSGAIVTFEVGAADDCFIPTIITPNGDNLNDFFQIPAECYPEGAAESEVSIFNQWGDQVFYGKPYLNNWDGTYKGDELPVGTYYYVVKLNAVEKPRTGFLLIQR